MIKYIIMFCTILIIKQTLTMYFMYKYIDFIVKFIQDTGEALTGLTGIKWSCDIRRDNFPPPLFAVMVVCVRSKEYVRPHILDDVVMHEVFKGDIFEFIALGNTNNWIVLCESQQDWFQFVTMYKTRTTHGNFTKKVRWEGI